MRQLRPAPASVFCKDQAARQSRGTHALAYPAFVDSAGRGMVEYRHDAWGKLLFTVGSLAGILGKRDSFHYRGHVCAEESELYYLRGNSCRGRCARCCERCLVDRASRAVCRG